MGRATSFAVVLMAMGVAFILTPTVLATPIPLPAGTPEPGNRELFLYLRHDLAAGGPVPVQVAGNNFLMDPELSQAAGAMRGGVHTFAIGTIEVDGRPVHPVLDLVMSDGPFGPVFAMAEPWEYVYAGDSKNVVLINSPRTTSFITEFAVGGELKDVPGVRLMAGKGAADISGDIADFPSTCYFTDWTGHYRQPFGAVIDVYAVPEPGTIAMLLTGLIGSALLIRRRRKAAGGYSAVALVAMALAFVLTPAVQATPIPLPDGTPEPGNREMFLYLRHDLAAGGPVPIQVAGNNFLIDIELSQAAKAMRGGVHTIAIGTSRVRGVSGPPVLDLVMNDGPFGPVFAMAEPWELVLFGTDLQVVLANSPRTTTFITEFAVGGELKDIPGVRLIAGKSAADISGDVADFEDTCYFTDWKVGERQRFGAVIDVYAVPEPGAIAMLLTGLIGSVLLIRRRRKTGGRCFAVALMAMGVAFVLAPSVQAEPIPLPAGTPEPGNRELFLYLRHDLAGGGPVPVQVAGNNFLFDLELSQAAGAMRGGMSLFSIGTNEIDYTPGPPVLDLVMSDGPFGPVFATPEPWEQVHWGTDQLVVLVNSPFSKTSITEFAAGGELKDVPGVRLIAGKSAADISGDLADFPDTGYYPVWNDQFRLQPFDAVIDVDAVPEPGTIAMLLSGLMGGALLIWQRRKTGCRCVAVVLMAMGGAFVLTPAALATPIPLPAGTPEPGNRELFLYLRHDLAAGGPVPVQVAGNNFLMDPELSQAAGALRGGVPLVAISTRDTGGILGPPVFDLVMEQGPFGPVFTMAEPWERALMGTDQQVVLESSPGTTTSITEFAVGGELKDVPGVRLMAGRSATDISGDAAEFQSTVYFSDWTRDFQPFDAVIDVNAVPEPGTIAMLLTGLIGSALLIWRRRQAGRRYFAVGLMAMGGAFILAPAVMATPIPLPTGTPEPGNRELFLYLRHDLAAGGPVPVQVAGNNFLMDIELSQASGVIKGGVHTFAIGTSETGQTLGPPVLDVVMSPGPFGPVFTMTEPWTTSIWQTDKNVVLVTPAATTTSITEFAVGGELKDVPGVRLIAGRGAADISGDFSDFPSTGYGTHWSSEFHPFDAVIDVNAVPEPGTIAMLLTGLMGSALLIWQRGR